MTAAEPQQEELSIRKMLTTQSEAWNRGDGPAWAKDFTDDADFINVRGDIFHGRAEIAQRHAAILNAFLKGTHAVVTVRRFTLLTSEVALVETDQEVTGFQHLAPGMVATSEGLIKTHMKYVAIKRSGQWAFAAAQNTAVAPTTPAAHQ